MSSDKTNSVGRGILRQISSLLSDNSQDYSNRNNYLRAHDEVGSEQSFQEEVQSSSNSIGVVVNLVGAPETTGRELVLPLNAVSLEGNHALKLRRKDKRGLERLVPPLRSAVIDLYETVSVFDYEVQNKSKWRSLRKKRGPISKLDIANAKLGAFNHEVLFVKKEEVLPGTIAIIYYLLIRPIKHISIRDRMRRS